MRPSRSSSAPRRLLAALSLLLHLAVLGVVPLADAAADGGAGRAAVHRPGEHDTRCPPLHDHLYCQLCRVLDARGPAPEPPLPPRFAAALRPSPLPSRPAAPPAGAPVSSLGARAPPTV